MTGSLHRPETPREDAQRLRQAFFWSAAFAALLWAVHILESLFDLNLIPLGIFPRQPLGLVGVLTAPLIHGSFFHLISNTLPVLVLGTALIYGYPRAARIVLPVIYLGTGLLVWFFARPSWHIGASGLIFGMMFFVFTVGALRWDRRAIALSMAVFLLYGGMIWGIFPTEPDVSFESHFFGAALGVLLAFLLRRQDPPPPEKRYEWEDNDDGDWTDEDWDDFIGPDERLEFPESAAGGSSGPTRRG